MKNRILLCLFTVLALGLTGVTNATTTSATATTQLLKLHPPAIQLKSNNQTHKKPNSNTQHKITIRHIPHILNCPYIVFFCVNKYNGKSAGIIVMHEINRMNYQQKKYYCAPPNPEPLYILQQHATVMCNIQHTDKCLGPIGNYADCIANSYTITQHPELMRLHNI